MSKKSKFVIGDSIYSKKDKEKVAMRIESERYDDEKGEHVFYGTQAPGGSIVKISEDDAVVAKDEPQAKDVLSDEELAQNADQSAALAAAHEAEVKRKEDEEKKAAADKKAKEDADKKLHHNKRV